MAVPIGPLSLPTLIGTQAPAAAAPAPTEAPAAADSTIGAAIGAAVGAVVDAVVGAATGDVATLQSPKPGTSQLKLGGAVARMGAEATAEVAQQAEAVEQAESEIPPDSFEGYILPVVTGGAATQRSSSGPRRC